MGGQVVQEVGDKGLKSDRVLQNWEDIQEIDALANTTSSEC